MNRHARLAPSLSSSSSNPSRLHSRRRSLARAAVEAVEARRLLASVAGIVFNDANANGKRDAGEAGLYNEVVYADRNNNNVYDGVDVATRADASGAYKLANLAADGAAITIRVRGDTGSRVTSPAGNGYPVKLTTASPDLVGKDFAVEPVATTPTGTVTITGRAYVDNDRSGTYTPGDTTTAGTVYATTSGDGYQAGEPTTGRNAADGTYTLTGVPAGKSVTVVALKVIPNANLFQTVTTPAAGGALRVDFVGQPLTTPTPAANTISGRVTNDANGNGVVDAGEAGLYFEVVYLDKNNNGAQDSGEVATRTDANGNYAFANVALDGSTIGIRVRNGSPRVITAPAGGAYVLTLNAASTKTNLNFAISSTAVPTKTSTLSGRAFYDRDFSGTYSTGDATPAGTVFADLDGDRTLDAGEPSTTRAADGQFTLANLPGGRTFEIVAVGLTTDGRLAYSSVTTPAAGGAINGFALYARPIAIATPVVPFLDANGNGYQDGNEPFTPALDVWIDDNDNGLHDAGEQTGKLAADGKSYTVFVTAIGYPYSQYQTVAYRRQGDSDSSADGTRRVYYYEATSQPTAVYFPVPNAVTTAFVTGRVTDDANGNGVADAGEGGLAGIAVYADYDGDGRYDYDVEPVTLTNSVGGFALATKRGAFKIGVDSPTRREYAGISYPFTDFTSGGRPVALTGAVKAVAVDVTGGGTRAGVGFTAVNASYARVAPVLAGIDPQQFYEFAAFPEFTYAWIDANKNSVRDANEPAVARSSVYDDNPSDPSSYGYYDFVLPRGGTRIAFAPSDAVGSVASASFTATVTATSTPVLELNPTLPAVGASVFGRVFNDANLNGIADGGERTAGGRFTGYSLFADYNGNQKRDADEPQGYTLTDSDITRDIGYYVIHGLDPTRPFTVRLVYGQLDEGLVQTNTPRPVVGKNQFLTGQNVGIADVDHATVAGRVANDVNNGGVAGLTVYADYDGDGVLDADEPRSITNANGGGYSLTTKLGAFDVRLALGGTAYAQVSPAANAAIHVDVTHLLTKADQNFVVGQTSTATVTGRVTSDANRNGVADAGEGGLAGVTAYADYNANGLRDAGESSAVTDAGGNYSLSTKRGAFAVRLVPPPSAYDASGESQFFSPDPSTLFIQTGVVARNVDVTGATASAGVNLTATQAGYLRIAPRTAALDAYATARFNDHVFAWLDANANGKRDANEPLGVRDSGRAPDYAIHPAYSFLVPANVAQRFAFGASRDVGAAATTTGSGVVTPNAAPFDPIVITVPTTDAAVFGYAFLDANGNGVVDGADAPLTDGLDQGIRILVDYNNNGVADAGEPTELTVADNEDAGYNGYFYLSVTPGRPFALRLIDELKFKTQTLVPQLSVPANTTRTINVGARRQSTTISGRVTNDANANGVADAGEGGLSFEIVYLDANNNGLPDTGETAIRTDPNGYYSFSNVPLDGSTVTVRLRSIFAPRKVTAPSGNGYAVTLNANARTTGLNFGIAPAPVVGGRVYDDANYNRTPDAGEGGLGGVAVFADYDHDGVVDGNEPSTTTLADGTYALSTNRADFQVRAIFGDASYAVTQPLDGYDYAFLTTAQQATANFGFGRIATVSGRVDEDANRNGRPDNGEGGIAGVLVYADYNGNGQADYLEPAATSDANGVYSFDTRRAAFSVRIAQPSLGYVSTNYAVQLTSATTNNGVAIDVTSAAKKVDVNFSGLRLTEVSIAPHLANADAEAFYRFGGGPRAAWVDLDRDGVRDANEPLVGTNSASLDAGHSFPTYEFLLPLGAYEIDFATSGEVGATAAVRKTGTITTSTPSSIGLDGTVPTTETIAFGHVATAPFGPYPFNGTVYADYNDNQKLDAGEPTTSTFDGGVTYGTYNDYFALHVDPGRAFTIRLTNLPPNFAQTVAPRLTVAANQFLTGADVAVVNRAAAVVSGHVFNDANRNGVKDAGETLITQQEAFVYADYNNDGVIESDEPGSGAVDRDGDMIYQLTTMKGSFALRLFLRPGYVQTSPANGAARIVDLTNTASIDGQDFGIAPA